MKEEIYDVVIIGAGAAGLMAAWELVQVNKRVVIAEARDRIGGRVHTVDKSGFTMPVELGAEFIHGELPLTKMLLKKAGVDFYKVKGDIWRKQDTGLEQESDFIEDYSLLEEKLTKVESDMPVAEFLNTYLAGPELEELRTSLLSYVEGYYAADPKRTSTFALREELEKGDEEQYRVAGGYRKMIRFLEEELEKKGCPVLLSTPALEVNWQSDPVEVYSAKSELYGRKLIVTVPLGVLQAGAIAFTPAIPGHLEASRTLGFGAVIKVLLQFGGPFWKQKENTAGKDLSQAGFIFSEEEVPTWWTQEPKEVPILVGWLAGPHAERMKHLSEEDILQKALASLGNIFTMDMNELRTALQAHKVSNWAADPYCLGGYSYEVVHGSKAKQKLKEPINNRIFFAGEALFEGVEGGTVEAALANGLETAHQVIASF
ncbi:MAG TPA: NAD(P)/FAD-dependent oxidoreductase [Chitinophagaceae bacterium]